MQVKLILYFFTSWCLHLFQHRFSGPCHSEVGFTQFVPVSGLSDLIGTNGALCSTELECALNLAKALCCFSSSSSCDTYRWMG